MIAWLFSQYEQKPITFQDLIEFGFMVECFVLVYKLLEMLLDRR